jgi:hypothetical protein
MSGAATSSPKRRSSGSGSFGIGTDPSSWWETASTMLPPGSGGCRDAMATGRNRPCLDTADIALMEDDLSRIPLTFRLGTEGGQDHQGKHRLRPCREGRLRRPGRDGLGDALDGRARRYGFQSCSHPQRTSHPSSEGFRTGEPDRRSRTPGVDPMTSSRRHRSVFPDEHHDQGSLSLLLVGFSEHRGPGNRPPGPRTR